jgi:1,4-dihydroxy-6-naphthoate synthase
VVDAGGAGFVRLLDGQFDAGLIIHENRFTYAAKGLKKIVDLGEYWEAETGAPIPLGGIVIKRALPDEIKERVNRVLRRSVEYAFAHRTASLDYVRAHAQEMDEDVMYRHIDLYVNQYSVDLGAEGRRAVERCSRKPKPLASSRPRPRAVPPRGGTRDANWL